ncbi:unnamed protein product [Leptidea sinapis]|uniref:Glycine zipper domain-containing protein n=1 Tax=Leptidea sinapis TaxID=189913 RepID=A0A5E4QF07_9NEOP|nr:unnamed protein product [Leptidea sinapis]
MSSDSESSGSDYEGEYDLCCTSNLGTCPLPFDPPSLENIILSITDKFNFRVILNDGRAKKAVLVTAGLSIAGALIGNRVGGKVGAAVGGAVGGACGLGVVVYDYLAGLGLEDYKRAAKFVMQNSTNSSQLAMLILQFATNILGKQILSSLTPM